MLDNQVWGDDRRWTVAEVEYSGRFGVIAWAGVSVRVWVLMRWTLLSPEVPIYTVRSSELIVPATGAVAPVRLTWVMAPLAGVYAGSEPLPVVPV